MPCTSSIANTPHQSPKDFQNWARRIDFTAQDAYQPSSRGEVVQIITQAEESNRRIKWVGSLWSFTRNFVGEDIVVETESISGQISSDLILDKLSLSPSYSLDELVHIKGGTKIFNLNRILHGLPPAPTGGMADEIDLDLLPASRATPTLGGSGGQSIAGLLATGSHGGDVHLPPMADAVAAIHLIGPGGQEWWIERASDPLTRGPEGDTTQTLREHAKLDEDILNEICDDVIAKKDDALFNSVLVAVGRMGFIYSLVIKTVDGFKLEENRTDETWEEYYENLTSPRFEPFLMERETAIGRPLHYLQVLINPFRRNDGTHQCKIAERHVVDRDDANVGMDQDSAFDITGFICRQQDTRTLLPYLIGIEATLIAASAALVAAATALLAIPIVGWALAATLFVAAAALLPVILAVGALILTLSVNGAMTSGELIALIANFAFRFGYGGLMRTLLTFLFDSSYPTGPNARKRGVGWKIMDTYGYGAVDYCQKVDSLEVAFDVFDTTGGGHIHSTTEGGYVVSTRGYIQFIFEILNLFDELIGRNLAIAGVLALRYTRRTSAKLGMSRFYISCHVEIPILQGFAANREFLSRAQEAAIQHGGVPSWGQVMDGYNAADIANIFGNDLTVWRQSLRGLIDWAQANDSTFSNAFTTRFNLEP